MSPSTYETASREISRLLHKDLHGGLTSEEGQLLERLSARCREYEQARDEGLRARKLFSVNRQRTFGGRWR